MYSFISVWIILLSFFPFLPSIRGLGVIVPVYFDPGRSCQSWSAIASAINAHPNTVYYSIINPDNGPGADGTQPDDSYQLCIKSLRPAGQRSIVLGYIDTETGSLPMSRIRRRIDTYANWDSSYRPNGILFDWAASSAEMADTYSGYASYARGNGFTFIALDVGEVADAEYYTFADLVNTYEDKYNRFARTSDIVFTDSTPASKQSVILVNTPRSMTTFKPLLSQFVQEGLNAVFITDQDWFFSDLPEQWTLLTDEVEGLNAPAESDPIQVSQDRPRTGTTSSIVPPTTPVSGGSIPSEASREDRATVLSVSVSTTGRFRVIHSQSPSAPNESAPFRSSPTLSGSIPSESSASSAPNASAEAAIPSSSDSGLNIGGLIGGILGGLVGLAMLALITLVLRRKQRRWQVSAASRPDEESSPETASRLLSRTHSTIEDTAASPSPNSEVPVLYLDTGIDALESKHSPSVAAISPLANSTSEERNTQEYWPAPSSWDESGNLNAETEEKLTGLALHNRNPMTEDDAGEDLDSDEDIYECEEENMDPPPAYSRS